MVLEILTYLIKSDIRVKQTNYLETDMVSGIELAIYSYCQSDNCDNFKFFGGMLKLYTYVSRVCGYSMARVTRLRS